MTIDWSSLTAEQVYAALKTAPKVAGPWELTAGTAYTEMSDGSLVDVSMREATK